ncbi:hypothetical protein ACN4DJ_05755 [Corynebacterium macclintockiae]|uniref:hypothetical protein n=1 Tax=Corynebacterium macclintockiae TaxID=2913501 RepID=UPI003EBB7FF6
MAIQELQNSIRDLTPADWDTLLAWVVGDERERRNAERSNAQLLEELQDAGKLPKRDVATVDEAKADKTAVPEWRDPGTDHAKMYHYGDVVRYQGKLVRSTRRGLNHWAPGTLGFDGRIWEVVKVDTPATTPTSPAAPAIAAFKQPSGAHDAYKQGDRVTYKGATWESTIDANVWAPDTYPQGWKRI